MFVADHRNTGIGDCERKALSCSEFGTQGVVTAGEGGSRVGMH